MNIDMTKNNIIKYDPEKGRQLCQDMKMRFAKFPYELGETCEQIRDNYLYPGDSTYTKFIIAETGFQLRAIQQFIAFKSIVDNLWTKCAPGRALPPEKVLRPLTSLMKIPEAQIEVWEQANDNGHSPTFESVKEIVKKVKVQYCQKLTKAGKPTKLCFNWTSEKVDWAQWTWNPIFGCKHNCPYCYAPDFAKRQHREFTKPDMVMHMLSAPKNTVIPDHLKDTKGIKNVFVCSMSDMFGEWVKQEWLDMVFNACRDNPQWNYIFLTKNPEKMIPVKWQDNWAAGTTVDCQDRVKRAENAFAKVNARHKFVSLEPFNEHIKFNYLEYFETIVIGGRSRTTKVPAFQPKWEWVLDILIQAKEANCKVYFKPNLEIRPSDFIDFGR